MFQTLRQHKFGARWAVLAAVWAIGFAALSFYWAAGGRWLISTLAHSIQDDVRSGDRGMIVTTWITGGLKLLAGLIAVAMISGRDDRIPRWMVLLGGYAAGVIMTIYRAASLIEKILMEFDAIDVPNSFGEDIVRWYLVLWDPFWLLGGLLFLAATRGYQSKS